MGKKCSPVVTFFFFEENAFWASLILEEVLKVSKNCPVRLIVFTRAIDMKLNRHKGWINSQGGYWHNFSGPKNAIRRFFFFPKFNRPSEILQSQLKSSPNVEIIRLPRNNRQVFLQCDQEIISMIEKLVNIALGEDLGTDHVVDLISKQSRDKHVHSAEVVAKLLNLYIDPQLCSRVVYVNGRTLHERLAYEICKKKDIPSQALEFNISFDRIQKFEGTAVNPSSYAKEACIFWDDFVRVQGLKLAQEKGDAYFSKRTKDKKVNQFIQFHQTKVNRSNSNQKLIYTFFTSSNEELRSLYSIYGGEPPDQNSIILEMLDFFQLEENQNKKLIIRVHPNVRRKRKIDKDFYLQLPKLPNVELYNFDSNVNSYDLIELSDFVITSGSTIGLEATYQGKPSFTFSRTIWDELGIEKKISQVFEILDGSWFEVEKAKLNSRKFGLYMVEGGESFSYLDPVNLRVSATGRHFDQTLRFKKANR